MVEADVKMGGGDGMKMDRVGDELRAYSIETSLKTRHTFVAGHVSDDETIKGALSFGDPSIVV